MQYCTWLIHMGLVTAIEGWESNICMCVQSYVVASYNNDTSKSAWKNILMTSRWSFNPRLFLEIRGFAACCGEILTYRYLGNSSLQGSLTLGTIFIEIIENVLFRITSSRSLLFFPGHLCGTKSINIRVTPAFCARYVRAVMIIRTKVLTMITRGMYTFDEEGRFYVT